MSRFVDEQRGRFGVEPICRVLGVSASAYYQRASGERSRRAVEDEWLLAQIERVHGDNYHAYGYRRTWKALGRNGVRAGRDRVKRLMRAHGIQGAKRRGKPWRTTRPNPAHDRAPDLVNRDFTADGPDRLWVADFTYVRCWEGMVYFSFVIDVFSRRIAGWQLAGHMRTDLVLDALRMALSRRRRGADVELVHHSDANEPGLRRSQPGSPRPSLARPSSKPVRSAGSEGSTATSDQRVAVQQFACAIGHTPRAPTLSPATWTVGEFFVARHGRPM